MAHLQHGHVLQHWFGLEWISLAGRHRAYFLLFHFFRASALLTSVLGVSLQSTILPTGLPGTTAPPSDVQNPYAPDLLICTPNIVRSLTSRLTGKKAVN